MPWIDGYKIDDCPDCGKRLNQEEYDLQFCRLCRSRVKSKGRKKMEPTVASEGDGRVVNNTVRHNYRVLSDAEKASMVALKDKGLEFIELCNAAGKSREMSLAITKAEEAVMWAVKHITQ
jgi:DNA-directed RNA polymerase subunit RPC12/RpoP